MPQPNIIEYLPKAFAEVKEMKAYANTLYYELSALWEAIYKVYYDQFLYSLTEYGIKKWESILHIQPLAMDTLEDRRFRIITKVNARLPYTYRMLEIRLNQMCGKDGYTMSYDPDTYTLCVRVSLTRKNQLEEIQTMINEMIPVVLILDYDLQYNSYRILSQFTHAQLSQYTNEQLRSMPLNSR